ncbi:MAG: radical SAM family heme chaperone HemW [Woeseiaceae bacterium]
MNSPPLSLYVHLPWCVQKCPYCDFNSHSARGEAPVARYVDALLADLDREATRAGGRTVESVYLGGGTPSLFPPDEIGRLLHGINQRLSVAAGAEITMEVNPGTVECGSPAGYRAAGVNRVSIGAQSFDDASLQRLGRIHSAADIRRSVDEFVAAGFDNFNLDLMHGLPRQTVEMAMADLRAALDLGPVHLSWYQLTLEPNTVFHARPPTGLPDDETAWAIQDAGEALLGEAGFARYEVSAWARDGRVCRHNLNYWQFGDYLAAGAGAHGKITDGETVLRYRKPAHPLQYLELMEAGEHGAMADVSGDNDLVFEFMLNALRLVDGFEVSLFEQRTGLALDTLEEPASEAFRRGLLEQSAEGRWRPTALGMRFLDDLQAEFLPAP